MRTKIDEESKFILRIQGRDIRLLVELTHYNSHGAVQTPSSNKGQIAARQSDWLSTNLDHCSDIAYGLFNSYLLHWPNTNNNRLTQLIDENNGRLQFVRKSESGLHVFLRFSIPHVDQGGNLLEENESAMGQLRSDDSIMLSVIGESQSHQWQLRRYLYSVLLWQPENASIMMDCWIKIGYGVFDMQDESIDHSSWKVDKPFIFESAIIFRITSCNLPQRDMHALL